MTLLANNNTFSGTNLFTGNTTFTNATSTTFAISNLANTLLAVNANGSVVATSTIGNNQLQNSTISGVSLGSNLNSLTATNGSLTFSGSYNGSAAQTVGLNLANANAWTGLQQFTNSTSTLATITTGWATNFNATYASSTALTVSGNEYLTGITNGVLSTNAQGQVVATTSIGTNYLTGVLGTVNGTALSEGGSITVAAASSTLLANNNTFSGTTIFSNGLTVNNGLTLGNRTLDRQRRL